MLGNYLCSAQWGGHSCVSQALSWTDESGTAPVRRLEAVEGFLPRLASHSLDIPSLAAAQALLSLHCAFLLRKFLSQRWRLSAPPSALMPVLIVDCPRLVVLFIIFYFSAVFLQCQRGF